MINTLTSLRFFAAAIVFLHHYIWIDFSFDGWPLSIFWSNLIKNGFLGVSFFYVLSGFVLAHAYQEKILNQKIGTLKFYVARVARIYPLHLLTLILAVPLMLTSPWSESALLALPFNLTLTQSLIPSAGIFFSYNSPSWSISNELIFYLFFPLLIQLKTKNLLWVSVFIVFAIIIYWLFIIKIDSKADLWYWSFYINPFFRLAEFMLGIITYRISIGRFKQHGITRGYATALEIVALFLLIVAVSNHYSVPGFLSKGLFYAPLFALIILVFSMQSGLISMLLKATPFVYLGEISFSVYMIHQIIIRYIHEFSIFFFQLHPLPGLLILFVFLLLLSAMTHHLLEIRMNKIINRAFDSRIGR